MTTPSTPADYDPIVDQGEGCGNCGATTTDQLCPRCVRKAEKWAAEMPALVRDLELTITRQTNYGQGAKRGKGDDRPLLFNPDAADKREHVAIFLEWARHIEAEANPLPVPPHLTVGSHADVCRAAVAIVANVAWFRTAPQAATCLDALWTIRTTLLRAVDRPAARWNVGPCGHVRNWATLDVCDLDVYARPPRKAGDPPVIVCDGHRQPGEGCGTVHTLGDRRRFLLASLADELVTLDAILPTLPGLIDRQPDKATVRQWRARRRLVPHGTTAAGAELYRGADVLRLALDNTGRPGRKPKARA